MGKPPTAGADHGQTVLGVRRSLSGRHWRLIPVNEQQVEVLRRDLALPEILARLLAARGIDAAHAADYLSPSLKSALPDPSNLVDMDRAASRLAQAILAGEKVAIFGDYAVDGATSSALFHRYFASLGRPLPSYVPDRMTERDRPNIAAF